MSLANELAELWRRDLTRLAQEIEAFPDGEALWRSAPGISNSAGNLVLHLEGNLREYVGRQLGGTGYQRRRSDEFSTKDLTRAELLQRVAGLRDLVCAVIADLSLDDLAAPYPENVLGPVLSTQQFVIHLHGHFNYHLGQIDYLRRMSCGGTALEFAGLGT